MLIKENKGINKNKKGWDDLPTSDKKLINRTPFTVPTIGTSIIGKKKPITTNTKAILLNTISFDFIHFSPNKQLFYLYINYLN